MNQKHIGIAGTSEGGAQFFEQLLLKTAGKNPPKISTALADFEMMQRAEKGNMISTTVGLMRTPIKNLIAYNKVDIVGIPSFSIASNSTYPVLEMNFGDKLPLNMMELAIQEAKRQGLKKPGLMGVKTTIEGKTFIDSLKESGMDPVIPSMQAQEALDKVIYGELAKGQRIEQDSRELIKQVTAELKGQKADGIIIACSDLARVSALINAEKVVDSTRLLAQRILEYPVK